MRRAVGRFLVTRGVGGYILRQTIFKFGGSETLFSALVMRYRLSVSEKSTSNKCEKAGIFMHCLQVLIFEVLLI